MTMQPRQTGRGHEEPCATQFSVFLPNRVGRLRDLLTLLGEQDVPVLGLAIADATEWAVIRLICSDPPEARAVLARRGIAFTEQEVILVELPQPDALRDLCALLLRAELNINFAYPLLACSDARGVMVLHVDDQPLGAQLLVRAGYTLLGQEDLGDPPA